MRRFFFILLSMLASFSLSQAQAPTMLELIRERANLSVMENLIDHADPQIATLLSNRTGNYTFFVPSDDAFGRLERFLNIEIADILDSRQLVTDLIAYHLVVGRIYSADIRTDYNGASLPTLLPATFITLERRPDTGELALNEVIEIVRPDFDTRNGVIHIVNDVGLNPIVTAALQALDGAVPVGADAQVEIDVSEADLADDLPELDDLLTRDARFTSMLQASLLADSEVINTLGATGSYTLFVPTNLAFNQLLATLRVETLEQVEREMLTEITLYHIIPIEYTAISLENRAGTSIRTLLDPATIFFAPEGINRRAHILEGDIVAQNGLLHIIDTVLLPSSVIIRMNQ